MIEILATWRLASLLVDEDGPFEVFAKLRDFVGVQYDAYSQPRGTNEVSKALTCIWCTSVWTALFIAIIRRKVSIVNVLAWSAGAIFISERMKR
jgi:hypothetical protein